jgi:hypothetical protein
MQKRQKLCKAGAEGEGQQVRGSRPWTSEDDQRLRELAGSGTTVADIAGVLNRSPSAVRTRASVLKIRVARSGFIRGLKANCPEKVGLEPAELEPRPLRPVEVDC